MTVKKEIEFKVNDIVHYEYEGTKHQSNFVLTASIFSTFEKEVKAGVQLTANGKPIFIKKIVRNGEEVYEI